MYSRSRSQRDSARVRRRGLPIRPYLHARITRITSVEQLPQTSRCKHWSGLSQGRCRRKLTCLPPSEPCQHIARLGEATIPADANIGQGPHCAHKEACSSFILLWRRSCTPQGGMLLITSLGEATIPADANTGQACRRVVAVGSSPAYHRLSHANT